MTRVGMIWRFLPRWASVFDQVLPLFALLMGPMFLGVLVTCYIYVTWMQSWTALARTAGFFGTLAPFVTVGIAYMFLGRSSEPTTVRALLAHHQFEEQPKSKFEELAPFANKSLGHTRCQRLLTRQVEGRESIVVWTAWHFAGSRNESFAFTVSTSVIQWDGSLHAGNARSQRKLDRALQSAGLPNSSRSLDGWPESHLVRTDSAGLLLARQIANDPTCRGILHRWGPMIGSISVMNERIEIQIGGRPSPILALSAFDLSERIGELIPNTNDNRPA